LTEIPQTALTSARPNQSRLRRKSGSHPLIETADLSEQTEPSHLGRTGQALLKAFLSLWDADALVYIWWYVSTVPFSIRTVISGPGAQIAAG